MTEDPVTEILEKIEKLLSLERTEIESGRKISEEIRKISEKIMDIPDQEKLRKEISQTVIKTGQLISKLSKDVVQSHEGDLDSDWKRIAEKDMMQLKDEILVLKNTIKKNEDILRKRFNEKNYGSDINYLVDRLKKTEGFDDILKNKLESKIEKMDEEKLQKRLDNSSERLNRISDWILKIKEVDQIDR